MASDAPFQLGAQMVLEDCREALRLLEEQPSGTTWRVQWSACCTLLRTVRNVLFEVDIKDDTHPPELVKEVQSFRDGMKASEPEPKIYWGFIAESANIILHEYDLHAGQGITIHVGANIEAGEAPHTRSYPIHDGPFEGQDQRDVVREAIDWWEKQLEEIIIKAAARSIATLLD
ncbi:MAG: hypothetical protein HOL66_15945 [Rhodospirillaceae bacterium]|jgi:hypothetical protein|nr:hypothetical protein [Nitrospinaceae bacterium]MBT4431399.1 hypothetical protein [Nitrospinaceae bacterium]MBT4932202.1 hypothetical protein [Rhodospirillaceae bacterium]MBT5245727.1 hypothetical protein [Rhodospirillaceae bacterium]MBT6242917.1 hypothetical protein [Rhodospirillaceae bacterium]